MHGARPDLARRQAWVCGHTGVHGAHECMPTRVWRHRPRHHPTNRQVPYAVGCHGHNSRSVNSCPHLLSSARAQRRHPVASKLSGCNTATRTPWHACLCLGHTVHCPAPRNRELTPKGCFTISRLQRPVPFHDNHVSPHTLRHGGTNCPTLPYPALPLPPADEQKLVQRPAGRRVKVVLSSSSASAAGAAPGTVAAPPPGPLGSGCPWRAGGLPW